MNKVILTNEEKIRFSQWVIENIDDHVVPCDEGNGEALVFNLVHAIRGDNERYDYQDHQHKELSSWGLMSIDEI